MYRKDTHVSAIDKTSYAFSYHGKGDEGKIDPLRVFLGNTLFENLSQRLDKLFCLDTTKVNEKSKISKDDGPR
jgi:hypothetical protein